MVFCEPPSGAMPMARGSSGVHVPVHQKALLIPLGRGRACSSEVMQACRAGFWDLTRFSPSNMWVLGIELRSRQAWQQAPLPTETALKPIFPSARL